jgi:hypothetical protein
MVVTRTIGRPHPSQECSFICSEPEKNSLACRFPSMLPDRGVKNPYQHRIPCEPAYRLDCSGEDFGISRISAGIINTGGSSYPFRLL